MNTTIYDLDRDRDIKARLQEIMNKYNIKQVEVARETGTDFIHSNRNSPFISILVALRKDQRPYGKDFRDY